MKNKQSYLFLPINYIYENKKQIFRYIYKYFICVFKIKCLSLYHIKKPNKVSYVYRYCYFKNGQ